jgi:ADP-heptose:LPS heptosyltransferase
MNFCSGAATRVGFHTLSLSSRGRLLTHRVYLNPYRHAMENFLALGGAVGIAARDRALALRSFRAAEERKGFVWLRKHGLTPGRYVLFSPLGDLVKALKSYPEDRWAELADALYRQAGCPSVVIAATADRRWDLKVSRVRNYLHNLTGKTSFTALMVLIKHALCLISVDTGIAHLAAVFQVPTLTLFGPETPQLYAPVNPRGQVVYANLHCSPCMNLLEGKGSDCRNNVCINQWTAQEVCQRVVALLKTDSSSAAAKKDAKRL